MIDIRNMATKDLELVLSWAADEGWNPGLDDAQTFLAADPKGFFLAFDDDAPVAAISVVNHSDDFAFLGLYICQPSHRGKGIGYSLWNHALKHAGDRTVGLDGVPEQQANYVRSGFALGGETIRFEGSVNANEAANARMVNDAVISSLISLEAKNSGWKKVGYLSTWFQDSSKRKTFLIGPPSDPRGCVTVRECQMGAKIGPLMAKDRDTALKLIEQAATVFGNEITIDVPHSSTGLLTLCQELGLTSSFSTTRMYRGPNTKVSGEFFSVVSLELG